MKKIIRLTESDLHRIIERSVRRIIKEDVLGDDWREKEDEDGVMNNYEPFEDQIERYNAETEFRNQHDWGAQGEEEFDPTFYEEPGNYHDDIVNLSDGDLYRGSY